MSGNNNNSNNSMSTSDLAPFVATVLRDRVMADLRDDNIRLIANNTRLIAELAERTVFLEGVHTRAIEIEARRAGLSRSRLYPHVQALVKAFLLPPEIRGYPPIRVPNFLLLIVIIYVPLLLQQVTASAIFGKGVLFFCTHGLGHDDYCNL